MKQEIENYQKNEHKVKETKEMIAHKLSEI